MKKFSRSLFLFFLFPFLVLLILVILHIILPFTSDYDYDGGLKIKHELLLKNKKQKKIVFIGGSNLAMGLDSKKLQKEFIDYKIINYGHRFQFGLNFYFNEIKEYIDSGDIVVIVPEYEIILKDYFGKQALTKIYLERLNNYPLKVDDIDTRSVFDYIIERFKFLIALKNGYFKQKENHNKIDGFNEFGDLTCHWKFKHKQLEIYNDVKNPILAMSIQNQILNFNNYCKNNQIKVLLIPPMNARNNFIKINNLTNFNIAFWNKLGIPYLCKPEDMVIDDSFFYDTPYHLLYQGVQIKTDKIIQILKHFIN